MKRLTDFYPTADALLAAPLAGLAGAILQVLSEAEPGMLNLGNFAPTVARHEYGSYEAGEHQGVRDAVAEAWSWLVTEGFLCPRADHSGGWVNITRRGREGTTAEGFAEWTAAQELPAHMVHANLVPTALALFHQGRFDTAVFEAFKGLEVTIRDAAELGHDLIGTRLVARAFDPTDGRLTDTSAEAGERTALLNLMSGAIGSYKNPHSHRHVSISAAEAREMILLASHLLRIVDSRRPT